ncbi:hypothetical protein KFE94_01565 [bacterium SCSIO 12643]|nr:hypothetical protein KFE94_01565 [bacterium SCSIO 12643]
MKTYLRLLFISALIWNVNDAFAQQYSRASNQTITYDALIHQYQKLSNRYQTCDLITFGETDSGRSLHLFLINGDSAFYPEALQQKTIILIQNGIHAGEPCGIDASLEWAKSTIENNKIPENVVIGIIPVYNVGGMLNRGCCSRANQNGPETHGFRGNARNLDLNRDYIKNDSKNATSFTRLFHWLKPHIFIDTHTSNGADYEYTMTLLSPRKERLDAHLSQFLVGKLEPYIYDNFKPLTPYVNVFGTTPNNGIHAFNDLPRFSTGYVSLFNCIGFTTEAHMWKPYDDRVEATKKFIDLIATFSNANSKEIIQNKRTSDTELPMPFEAVNLKLDTTRFDMIPFKSYKAEYRYSEILGRKQLYYDRNAPEEISIKYYNYFDKVDEIQIPKYYVVSAAWGDVIDRLKRNQIQMMLLEQDSVMDGVGMFIKSYKSKRTPYEGHFLHSHVEVTDSVIQMTFKKGDYIIPTGQAGWRYLINVLEPKSEDSFFAWNFYDEIVQQKEWYSAYVFEPYAQQMLEEDPLLQMEYDQMMAKDKRFSESGDYRLYWLYKKSPYYEPSHNRLPILKIL